MNRRMHEQNSASVQPYVQAEATAGVPAFDATKPCLLTTADPTRTYCERCKNPHHACDHASGVAPTRGGEQQ